MASKKQRPLMVYWGSKRPRSKYNEQKEETHLNKHNFDLNKEPEEEDQIALNEEPQVDEDAKQNDEPDEADKAAFALCHFMFLRDITRDGNLEEEETEEEEKPLDSVLWLEEKEKEHWMKIKKPELEKAEWIKRMRFIAKRKQGGEDDSDVSFSLLSRWKFPATPPEKIVKRFMIEKCSKPIRKQMKAKGLGFLTLGLSKSQVRKKFLPFLEEAKMQHGKDGIRVSVYGPDGKVHEMKICLNEKKKELDFTFGWRKFVEDYEVKDICDFVTVWMFKHKQSREICLAIDIMRLSFTKPVSKRISKVVFDDSDSD